MYSGTSTKSCFSTTATSLPVTATFLYIKKKKKYNFTTYSWLPLSQLGLSHITAYFEVKIWSLLYYQNLTTGNKILWKRREIAPEEQFLFFSTIFLIYIFQDSNYIFICEMWWFNLFFPWFCKSDMSRSHVSKYFRESFGPRDNESRLYLTFLQQLPPYNCQF